MHPKISIIIPVLNQKQLLEKAIESILQQDFLDYELILIDGKSEDGTLDVIQKYEQHISYYESTKDKNVYEAMNKAIDKSNADWLYFMGADDCLSKNIFSNIFSNNLVGFEIVFGNIRYNDNTIFNSHFSNKLLMKNSLHHQGTLYHKRCFYGRCFNTNYSILADYDFNLQLFLDQKKALYINADFAICGKEGISKQKGWKHYKEEFLIKKEHLNAVQFVAYSSVTLIKFLLNRIGLL
ncbi:MAG: glycosyltransferase family 2 protein [Bacteroidota bacterium]|nr:glycosyltransferase family 2 protein [Bacteroidota bacterium]